MSVPIGSLHTATKTPARGARGQGLKERFLNSTERRPSRYVRVEVHDRAGRSKVLRLDTPCVARIRRVSHQPRLLHHNSRGVLPETFRMRVWLGGLEYYEVKAEHGSLCEIKGILSRQFFADVACTWLQADPVD